MKDEVNCFESVCVADMKLHSMLHIVQEPFYQYGPSNAGIYQYAIKGIYHHSRYLVDNAEI